MTESSPQTIVMRFDEQMMMALSLNILYTSRGDDFSHMTGEECKGLSTLEHVRYLFNKDEAGRRLLKGPGPGYFGSALAMALGNLFEAVAPEKRPYGSDGKPLLPSDMALSVLESALKFIMTSSQPAPEGPKRTENAESIG